MALDNGTFTILDADGKKDSESILNQLVDVVQEDVSGSVTRRKYQVFVTGGIGPGVTSSLFQTVYDQDFTLQTANAIFDVTFGLYHSGSTVQDAKTAEDSAGKMLFQSSSMKVCICTTISQYFDKIDQIAFHEIEKNSPIKIDDVLDSMVLFITALRIVEGTYLCLKNTKIEDSDDNGQIFI